MARKAAAKKTAEAKPKQEAFAFDAEVYLDPDPGGIKTDNGGRPLTDEGGRLLTHTDKVLKRAAKKAEKK